MECVIACDGVDVKVSFNSEFGDFFGGNVHDGREVASWFGVCAGAFVRTRFAADGSGVCGTTGVGSGVGSIPRLEECVSSVERCGDIVGVRRVDSGSTLEGNDIGGCHVFTDHEGGYVVAGTGEGDAVCGGTNVVRGGLSVSECGGVEVRGVDAAVGKCKRSSVTGGVGKCERPSVAGGVVDSGESERKLIVEKEESDFGRLLGPNGGVSHGRGPNYGRNCAKRVKAQRVKCEKRNVALQESLEAKWEAENRLAVKQAERKIALLDARDLEAEKKMQWAQIMRTTESAKVQTERAYAALKRTGNVPGFAETVVTDGSCPALSPSRSDGTCISPDSSVSQQEIRAMMKELEDYKLTLKRIERDNPALVAHHMEGHGVKTAFTLDSDGLCPVDEPGSMGADGKYHLDSYEPNPRFYKDRFRAEEFAEKYFGS